MKEEVTKALLEAYKNFVLIGEAGSGKTETALNLALAMAESTDKTVHFFDMDQTKPLFRARDSLGLLERAGIVFHFQAQYMDAPTVAPGVIETLRDEHAFVLMDIGGGSHGSHMIGQFSHILNAGNTAVLYLVNPYRPWSGRTEDIQVTMARITGAARLGGVRIVANPNVGPATTAREVVAGERKLRDLLGGTPVAFICVLETLCAEVAGQVPEPVFPIRLVTVPEWLE